MLRIPVPLLIGGQANNKRSAASNTPVPYPGNQIEVYPSSLSSSAASAISPGSPKARPAFQIPVPPSFTARTSRSALVRDRDILATHRCAPHQRNPCRQRGVAARTSLDRAFPRTGFTPLSTDRNRYPHNGGSAICRGQRMSLASQISTQKDGRRVPQMRSTVLPSGDAVEHGPSILRVGARPPSPSQFQRRHCCRERGEVEVPALAGGSRRHRVQPSLPQLRSIGGHY